MKNLANHRPMKCTPASNFLQASGKVREVWMSGIMQYKLNSIWLNTSQIQPRYCIETSFGFSCMMRNLYPRTSMNSDEDLEKFPASKVRQLAKKMEGSNAIACHIKQVAGYPQAVQINLMRHQHTEMPSGKHKKRKPFVKPKQSSHKNAVEKNPQVSSYNKKSFDPRNMKKNKDRFSKFGDSTHVEGFQCPAKKFQCKACHKFGHFTSLC